MKPWAGCGEAGRGAVDDEQTADVRVETALDQVVQQRLHHRRVLRRAFQHTERMLHAIATDADRGQYNQIVLYMNAGPAPVSWSVEYLGSGGVI
jgi:hypothetical protein